MGSTEAWVDGDELEKHIQNMLTFHSCFPPPQKGFAGGKVSLRDCFNLFTKEEELESENAPVCGVPQGIQ